MGAMPGAVRQSLARYAEAWARDGQESWEAWFPALMEWGDRVGELFHAEKDTVVFHQNVSVLMAVVASCLRPTRRRHRVVYTTLNFPTNDYFWRAQEGIEVVKVKSPDGIRIPTEAMVKAIDDRTLAVLIDHGVYVSGYLQDVAPIAWAAAKHGAVSIVDAYQTVGCVPIDVRKWGIDFLVGGAHKWLCGGPGAAFLYTRPDRLFRSEPRMTGWISAERPFAFDPDMCYAENARRFAGGTPVIASLHAAMPGIDILREVTPARVRAKNIRQMTRLIGLADARGIRMRSPRNAEERSGLVILDFPGAESAVKELIRRRIFVDYRPRAGIRVSAHFYTTDDEIDTFFDAIDGIRRR